MNTSYRFAILFAVFEIIRFKSRIAFSFYLLILNSARIRIYNTVCDKSNISLDSYDFLFVNYNKFTVSKSNKVACSWIFKGALGDVNLRRGKLSPPLCHRRS
jgi:hypothetical protein